MKCRIFKKQGGSIILDWPSTKYQENLDSCRVPNEFQGLESLTIDESDLPPIDSSNGNFQEMLYFDGDCKKENLKQDKEWKVCLMPTFLIKQKHLARCNAKLDEELAKETPDSIKIAKLQREKERCATWNDKQWYEQAKANIINENIDKPVILEKLNQKIQELS